MPETPPNEFMDDLKGDGLQQSEVSARPKAAASPRRKARVADKGFSLKLEIDGMAVMLFVVGVCTR